LKKKYAPDIPRGRIKRIVELLPMVPEKAPEDAIHSAPRKKTVKNAAGIFRLTAVTKKGYARNIMESPAAIRCIKIFSEISSALQTLS
jgi:hypothetical protein